MTQFLHSAESHTDFRIMQLQKVYGYAGIGIYYTLLEFLAQYGNPFKWDDIKILTFQMHVTRKKLESIIRGFDLFDFDEDMFWAENIEVDTPKLKPESALDTSAPIEEKSAPEENSATKPEEPELFSPEQVETVETIDVTDVVEEKVTKKKSSSFVLDRDNPPAWVEPFLLEPFAKFLTYKKEKGKSYKGEMSAHAAYNKLRSLAGTNTALANAIVEQTMAANYEGLFPLKNDGNGFQLSAREIAERERKQGIIDSIAQDYREMGYDEAAIARMFPNVI